MAESKSIYLLGICGTGVGALAGLLKRQGHRVRGSDQGVYPPMSDKLREWGIEVDLGWDPAALEPAPDLVVVGNVIRKDNPQAVAVRERGIPFMSMPQAVGEFGIGHRHALVVAGTHGKTSTTALAAHVLMEAGRDPGYLVGGALVGYTDSFRSGEGDVFVVEGDEYDTAYWDKGPKFWHYRAQTAVITSLEFDHADIYDSIEAIERSFAGLIERVPSHGHLVVWDGAARARRLIAEAQVSTKVTLYGVDESQGATVWAAPGYRSGPEGLVFEPLLRNAQGQVESLGEMRLPLWGDFSLQNALAVIASLHNLGVSAEQLRAGFASYRGVRRRMEVRGEPRGITVVDDFAHHPTAVDQTLRAARSRWPQRRIWALFEPRSATNRRNTHQHEFVQAFGQAARVIIGSHERLQEVPVEHRFDPARLAADLSAQGTPALAIASPADIAAHLRAQAQPGDVIMVLSNGDFGGLHDMLLRDLA